MEEATTLLHSIQIQGRGPLGNIYWCVNNALPWMTWYCYTTASAKLAYWSSLLSNGRGRIKTLRSYHTRTCTYSECWTVFGLLTVLLSLATFKVIFKDHNIISDFEEPMDFLLRNAPVDIEIKSLAIIQTTPFSGLPVRYGKNLLQCDHRIHCWLPQCCLYTISFCEVAYVVAWRQLFLCSWCPSTEEVSNWPGFGLT